MSERAVNMDRGYMAGRPTVGSVVGMQEVAFMPPMTALEREQVKGVALPGNFSVVSVSDRRVNLPGSPAELPATVVLLRSTQSGVEGSLPYQAQEAPKVYASQLPVAVGALANWWMGARE